MKDKTHTFTGEEPWQSLHEEEFLDRELEFLHFELLLDTNGNRKGSTTQRGIVTFGLLLPQPTRASSFESLGWNDKLITDGSKLSN